MTEAALRVGDTPPVIAMTRAALYLRVSTGRQAESDLSIPDQRRQIEGYCLSRGWEVAAALRTMDLPRLKIVMVSANAHDYFDPTRDSAIHDGYLVKPLDFQHLLERIEALLGLEWIDQAATPPAVAHERFVVEDYPENMAAHIAELQQLGRIGHVRGIERKLSEMENEDRVYAALVAELRALVRGFELKRFLEIVESAHTTREHSHE